MKKILCVSLVAMMAVTTVRAEIASKAYVDPGTGHYVASNKTAGANIKALDDQVYANTGAITTLNADDQTPGSVDAKIKTAVSTGTANGVTRADTTSAVGSATQPVYVNASGVATATDALGSWAWRSDTVKTADIEDANVTKAKLASGVQTTLDNADSDHSAIIDQTTGLAATYTLASGKQSPATTLQGYGITDAYTKTEMDTTIGTVPQGSDNVIDYVDDAIAAAGTTAGTTYQAKSTANYQMGKQDGTWETMSQGQQDALNSGATSTLVGKITTNETKIGTGAITAKAADGTTTATDLVTAVNGVDSRLATVKSTADGAVQTVSTDNNGGNVVTAVSANNNGTVSVTTGNAAMQPASWTSDENGTYALTASKSGNVHLSLGIDFTCPGTGW